MPLISIAMGKKQLCSILVVIFSAMQIMLYHVVDRMKEHEYEYDVIPSIIEDVPLAQSSSASFRPSELSSAALNPTNPTRTSSSSPVSPIQAYYSTTPARKTASLSTHTIHKDDISWLMNHVKVGSFLGRGSVTDVFRANIITPPDEDSSTNSTSGTNSLSKFIHDRRWILRISGCRDGKDTQDLTRNEIKILQRLNPDPVSNHHPAYPFLLYAAENIANPFRESDDSTTATTGNATPALTLPTESGIYETFRQSLITCPRVTLLVVERFLEMKPVFSHPRYLFPTNQMRCFWRRLFEVLGYAHEKNVMMRDPSKQNVVIQDGTIKLFDWNHGKVFDPRKPEVVSDRNIRFTGPPEYQKGRNDTYVNSHAFDVWVVGGWIDNLLKESDRTYEGDDRWLLRNLSKSMLVDDASKRPTLNWLLEHHPYFSIAKNETCVLSW